jgi:Ca2+-binding RTX toxin-like protein
MPQASSVPPSFPPSGFKHLAEAVLLNRAVYGGADDLPGAYLADYSAAKDPDAVGNRSALNVYDRYDSYLSGFGFRTLSSAELGFPTATVSASEATDGLDRNFTYRGDLFRNNYQKLPNGTELPFTNAGAVALAAIKEVNGVRAFHLVFRGTDADLGADGEAGTGPGQVRYYQQLEGLIDRVYDFVSKASNKIGEVVVSGHSLGGAMADLFALYDGARFAALKNVKLSVVALASAGVDPTTLALRPDYDKSLVTVGAKGITFKTPDWYSSYDQANDIVRNPGKYDAVAHAAAEPNQAPITAAAVSTLREHIHFEGNRLSVETPLTDQYKVSAPLATNFLVLHYASLYELIGSELSAASGVVKDIRAYDRVIALNGLNPESSKTPGTNDASGFGVNVNDTYKIGGVTADVAVLGLSGNDEIVTGSGSDFLFGGSGADRLIAGAGRDILAGGEGSDRLGGGTGNDKLYGDGGRDWLWGGFGDDGINGGSDHDILVGGAGKDRLFGDAGNDALYGGAGDDLLDGGSGSDTAVFAGLAKDYRISKAGGLVSVTDRDGDGGRDLLTHIEHIRFSDGDMLLV